MMSAKVSPNQRALLRRMRDGDRLELVIVAPSVYFYRWESAPRKKVPDNTIESLREKEMVAVYRVGSQHYLELTALGMHETRGGTFAREEQEDDDSDESYTMQPVRQA